MFDSVVVGAGPAGLTFARYLAKKGFDVLVLEKNKAIGEPRHDSGATFPEIIKKFSLNKNVIAQKVNSIVFETRYKSIKRKFRNHACILNRREFGRELSYKAIDEGVDVSLMSYVYEPILNSGVKGVVYKNNGIRREVKSRLVVDASGCENAIIAKKLGLVELIPPRTFSAECEFFCKNLDDPRTVTHGLGSYAPRGYAWIYPTGTEKVLVGLGQLGGHPKTVLKNLDNWVQKVFSKRVKKFQPIEFHICDGLRLHTKKTYQDNLLLIGSVAGHTNPLWAEGIRHCMNQAKVNAEICTRLLTENKLGANDLAECERSWNKSNDKIWKFLSRTVDIYGYLSDKDLVNILEMIDNLSDEVFLKGLRGELNHKDIMKYIPPLTRILGKQIVRCWLSSK